MTRLAHMIALAAMLCTGAAQAAEPTCYYNKSIRKLVPPQDARGEDVPVFATIAGQDAVAFSLPYRNSSQIAVMVVQDCRSGAELIVAPTDDSYDKVTARWNEMINGRARYSMRQIAAEMRSLGAQVNPDGANLGRCVCDAARRMQ